MREPLRDWERLSHIFEASSAHPNTPWRQIAGMRNVLVHDYYQIDVDELWDVIVDDIPQLKVQINQYLSEK